MTDPTTVAAVGWFIGKLAAFLVLLLLWRTFLFTWVLPACRGGDLRRPFPYIGAVVMVLVTVLFLVACSWELASRETLRLPGQRPTASPPGEARPVRPVTTEPLDAKSARLRREAEEERRRTQKGFTDP